MPKEIHYFTCDVCRAPLSTYKEAEECEKRHEKLGKAYWMK